MADKQMTWMIVEDDAAIRDVIEMMCNSLQLTRHVVAYGGRYFYVMPGQIDVHPRSPLDGPTGTFSS